MTTRYPWPVFSAPWSLELSEMTVDGSAVGDLVQTDLRRVRLDGIEAWQDMSATMVVTSSEAVPDDLPADTLAAFVLVSSPLTNRRIPVPLGRDGESLRLTGKVNISRLEVAGIVHMTCEVVADIEGRRRLVGSTEPWTIVVEPAAAPSPPGAPPFDFSWVDFDAESAPELARKNPHAHAIVDLSGKATLLLNAGLEGFQALVQADKAKLERRRLRDVLGSSLARTACAAVMREAAVSVTQDEEWTAPTDKLQAQVCEAVAGAMPSVGSADELYQRLFEAAEGSPKDRALVWAEIDVALDALTDVSATIATACSEVRYV